MSDCVDHFVGPARGGQIRVSGWAIVFNRVREARLVDESVAVPNECFAGPWVSHA